MNEKAEGFKVQFERDSTVSYSDKTGTLKFVFELGGPTNLKALLLYAYPVDHKYKPLTVADNDKAWVMMAVERTKEHLKSLGYGIREIQR